ncbi:hypothetical protein [Archangium sp.]|uniref:hypothetical protein n=1 Tax=Archangium sp. TaxID=1872627 RepID=UPI00286C6589|nr:hypothetical protein [Archangium sp.]
MIATLDDALFAAPVEPLLLLSILRHGQEGRHIILTDPSFQRHGQGAVNQWLAARDPLVRDAAEAALDRSLSAYNSTTSLAEFRVEARKQSHWEGTPPELTPKDAARVLALPLLLVLEDRRADKHFLRCVLPEPRRGELRDALGRGWIRAEHGGGLSNMKKYVETLGTSPPSGCGCGSSSTVMPSSPGSLPGIQKPSGIPVRRRRSLTINSSAAASRTICHPGHCTNGLASAVANPLPGSCGRSRRSRP